MWLVCVSVPHTLNSWMQPSLCFSLVYSVLWTWLWLCFTFIHPFDLWTWLSCFSLVHTPDLWMCLFIHLICECVCHVSVLFCWSLWFLNVSDMCQFCFVYLHDLWMCLTCVSFALFISMICECGCFIMFQFCSSRKSCQQTAETLVKRSWGHSSFVLPQFRQDITAAANRIKERKLSGRCALMKTLFVVMPLLHSLWYKHHGWLGIQNQLFI